MNNIFHFLHIFLEPGWVALSAFAFCASNENEKCQHRNGCSVRSSEKSFIFVADANFNIDWQSDWSARESEQMQAKSVQTQLYE